MRARQPCGSCASSTSLSPRRTTAGHVSRDDGRAPESSETLARYETTLIRVYPGVDTSRYVGVAGPPPSHVTGYQLNAPAEALLTNNTKRPLTTLMDFSAAADPWNFEGSEALFFAEKTRLGGVRMLLLEGPKAGS